MSHAVQSYIIFRAKMKTPDFSPGPESLDCALFPLEDIPFDSLAFSSIFVTLKMVSVPWMIGNSFVVWLQCLFGVLYDPRHDIFLLWLSYPHTRTYAILHASDALHTLFYSELFNCIWWGLSSHHLGVPIDHYYWGDLGSSPKPNDAIMVEHFTVFQIWSQLQYLKFSVPSAQLRTFPHFRNTFDLFPFTVISKNKRTFIKQPRLILTRQLKEIKHPKQEYSPTYAGTLKIHI